jgi:hypothetical protein
MSAIKGVSLYLKYVFSVLGALGFLVTGLEPDQIQGNFGIKDQRMAIQWYNFAKN